MVPQRLARQNFRIPDHDHPVFGSDERRERRGFRNRYLQVEGKLTLKHIYPTGSTYAATDAVPPTPHSNLTYVLRRKPSRKELFLLPRESDVETPGIVEESDALMLVSSDAGHDDEVLLAPLEGVHRRHFDLRVQLRVQTPAELSR